VCAEDAVFDIALNTNFEVIHHPANKKDKSDLLGQRGYVGSIFWSAAKVVNNGWCGVIEAGITAL
jgi:hypothetical protein